MKPSFKLQDLLKQGESAIVATSTLIGQGLVAIDCSQVESLTEEQLTQLFSGIPATWDFVELAEVFHTDTFSEAVAQQFSQWCDRRHGREPQLVVPQNGEVTEEKSLDIFKLRDEVIGDYRRYIESFLEIRDRRVEEFVKDELDKGHLWSDPLVQINPAYKQGAHIDFLIQEGVLHPGCEPYFRGYRFRYHQEQAFRRARQQQSYVLTTGTGSGKSLTYVVPIIDDLLRHPEIEGVRAILVYPMNALINSQAEEFQKFITKVTSGLSVLIL